MTQPHPNPADPLTEPEWAELCSLKEAININPASFMSGSSGMERFTSLMVKSLRERGA